MSSDNLANPDVLIAVLLTVAANVIILLCLCKSRGCREVPTRHHTPSSYRHRMWCSRRDDDEDLLYDSMGPPPYELPTLPSYEEVQEDPPPPYTVSEICETQEEPQASISGPHTEIYFS